MKRFLPTRESIQNHRWLRWLGPSLHNPLLWHVNRNSVARGAAIGVFFGIMIPVAQIPASAAVALLTRGNLWIATLATLVSNPFTYGPLYILAYRIGLILLPASTPGAIPEDFDIPVAEASSWLHNAFEWLTGIGGPLVLGMAVMAVSAAITAYFGVLLLWRINVILKQRRRQRQQRRAARSEPPLS